jgi:phosphopantothenoylcysteine decarboxylase/phosphopantothenate--cysteine ligase
MYHAVMTNLERSSIILMAAAVADYRPITSADQKIKKSSETILLELEPTQDILAAAGQRKGDRILVGFAAETQHLIENGRKKLTEKGADLIVANDVSASDSGFDVDTNKVTLITSQETVELPLLMKREAADRVLDKAIHLKQKSPDPAADISQYS